MDNGLTSDRVVRGTERERPAPISPYFSLLRDLPCDLATVVSYKASMTLYDL